MAIVSNNSINTISPNTGFGSIKDTLQSLYGEISRLQQAAYMRGINGKSVESKVMTFLDILKELGLAETPVEAQKYITDLFNIQVNEWNIDVENFWGTAKNDGVLYYKFNVFTVDNKITVTPFMIYIDPRLSSVSSYTGEKDFNDTSCMLEIAAKDSGYTIKANYLMPRLYWNKNVKAFCWNINGKQTSISAQGINGKDGADGNLKKCILATRVDTETKEGWYVKSDSSITVDEHEINNAIFRVSSNSDAYSSVSVDDNSLSVGSTVIACQYKLVDESATEVKADDYDSSGFKLADNSKTVVLDDIIFGTVGTKGGHYVVNGADTSFKSLITSSGNSDPFAQIEFSTVGTGGIADTNPIQHVHIKSGKDGNQHRLVSFKNSNNEDENGQPNLTTLSLVYATGETPKKIYSTPYIDSVSSFASTTASVFDIYNYNVNIENAKVKFKEDGSYFGNKVVLNADSNNKLFLNGFKSSSTKGVGNAKVVSNSCNAGGFIYRRGTASSTFGFPTIVWRRGIDDNDNYGARIDFGLSTDYNDYGTYLSLGIAPSSSTNTFKKVAVFGEKYSYIGCYNPSTGADNYLSITSSDFLIQKRYGSGSGQIRVGNRSGYGIDIYSTSSININSDKNININTPIANTIAYTSLTLKSGENQITIKKGTQGESGGITFTKTDKNADVYGTEFVGTNVYIKKNTGGNGGNLKVDGNLNADGNLYAKNLYASGILNASGNLSAGGNLSVVGNLSAGGNLLFTNGGFISFNGIKQRSLINKIIIKSINDQDAKLLVSKYFNDNGSNIKITPDCVIQYNDDTAAPEKKYFNEVHNSGSKTFYSLNINNGILTNTAFTVYTFGSHNWISNNDSEIVIASIKIENKSKYDLAVRLKDNLSTSGKLSEKFDHEKNGWVFGALSSTTLSTTTNFITSVENKTYYSNDVFTIKKETTRYLFLKVMTQKNESTQKLEGDYYDCELEFYI